MINLSHNDHEIDQHKSLGRGYYYPFARVLEVSDCRVVGRKEKEQRCSGEEAGMAQRLAVVRWWAQRQWWEYVNTLSQTSKLNDETQEVRQTS